MRPIVRRSMGVLMAFMLGALGLPATADNRTSIPGVTARQLPAAVTGVVHPLADYVRRGFTPHQALLLRELDALVAAGVPASAVRLRVTQKGEPRDSSSHEGAPPHLLCPWSFLLVLAFQFEPDIQPAGDLNGDHRPDVIETHYAYGGKKVIWVVSARDARSGRKIWTHKTALGKDQFAVALPMRVGSAGRPGVVELILGFKSTYDSKGDYEHISKGVTTFNGAGHRLWHRAYSGTVAFRFDISTLDATFSTDYTHAPLGVVPVQLRKGAQDVLVTTANTVRGVTTWTVDRLSGGNGAVSRSLTTAADDVELVPNQDGDGYVDLWSARLGSSPSMAAYNGATGKRIWVNTQLALTGFVYIEDAGVVVAKTGGRHDLAVTTGSSTPEPPTVGLPVDQPALAANIQAHNVVALITGGTGTTAWQRPGTAAYTLKRAGSPAVGALGVATATEVQAAVAEILVETIVTYDGAGKPVTAQQYSFQQPLTQCGLGTVIALPWAGDVDSDGTTEGEVVFIAFDDNGFYSDVQLIRGSDGAVLYHPEDTSLWGSLDGHGTDRYLSTGGVGGVTLSVRHGDTQKPLWSRAFSVRGKVYGIDAIALPVTSSRCEDLTLSSYGLEGQVVGLLASSGQPWWTVTYAGPTDVSGKLATGRVTSVLC